MAGSACVVAEVPHSDMRSPRACLTRAWMRAVVPANAGSLCSKIRDHSSPVDVVVFAHHELVAHASDLERADDHAERRLLVVERIAGPDEQLVQVTLRSRRRASARAGRCYERLQDTKFLLMIRCLSR